MLYALIMFTIILNIILTIQLSWGIPKLYGLELLLLLFVRPLVCAVQPHYEVVVFQPWSETHTDSIELTDRKSVV